MKKTRTTLKVSDIELNTGQLEWLPRNPRQWDKDDIRRTAASIQEDPDFLEDRPVLAVPFGDKYIAFGGNLRSISCGKAKVKEVPSMVYVPETEEDYATIKRRAMKDNGSFGKWDYDALANEWDDLPLTDWGVPVWNGDEGQKGSSAGAAAKEDNFDESGEIKVLCARGDVWQLGEHRLMCGDSVQLADVQRLMGGGRANMIFTDPPYGVAIGDKNKALNAVNGSHGIERNIENDNLDVDALYDLLRQAMSNGRESCTDDACYFVCAPPGGDMGLMMMMMMRDAGLNVRHQIVWNKSSATFSLGRLDYDYKHEAIMYTWTKSHHNYRKGEFRTSVWDIAKPSKCDLHPTMKPVALVANCILDGSKEGDIVLDLFGGSGTTMIAAEQLGRKAYLMEIDPHYCDIIIQRWEKFTGRKAIKN